MKPLISFCLLRAYLFVALVAAGYFGVVVFQRTTWNLELLFTQLVCGNENERSRAADRLAQAGGETQLLRALRDENAEVRQTAKKSLEHVWFASAGMEALDLNLSALEAEAKDANQEALTILNGLVEMYPRYAEAWHRRASLHWKLGNYNMALVDSERAVSLNPNHFDAWQGLGVAHLSAGNLEKAAEALGIALSITPHDTVIEKSLEMIHALRGKQPRFNPKPEMQI